MDKGPGLQDYTAVSVYQFIRIQARAWYWAYEVEPGVFRMGKNKEDRRFTLHSYQDIQNLVSEDQKLMPIYYRDVNPDYPDGKYSGKHLFVVPKGYQIPQNPYLT